MNDHEEINPIQDTKDDPAWQKALDTLRVGLFAAFGYSAKHLNEDPQVLAYWYQQFRNKNLTPEDVITAVKHITNHEAKPPVLSEFLGIATRIRESRCWREQHQEKHP